MKKILLATAAGLLFAAPATVAAQDCAVGGYGPDFSRYDTNADCALDDSEFTTVLESDDERFAAYDRNNDGIITEDEFGQPEYAEIDRNDNALIEAAEWATFWDDQGYDPAADPALEERGLERAGSEMGEDVIDANQPEQDVIE